MICKHIVIQKTPKVYSLLFKRHCIITKCDGRDQTRECFLPFTEDIQKSIRKCMMIPKPDKPKVVK